MEQPHRSCYSLLEEFIVGLVSGLGSRKFSFWPCGFNGCAALVRGLVVGSVVNGVQRMWKYRIGIMVIFVRQYVCIQESYIYYVLYRLKFYLLNVVFSFG